MGIESGVACENGAVRGRRLSRFAWLSIAAAITTIALKLAAWHLTGSVGLLSDAMESGVNLTGAVIALAMLTIAARPVDREHEFGHGKAEYFSSGAEGALILAAAAAMVSAAVPRFSNPVPLESLGAGAAVSAAASGVNLAVAVTGWAWLDPVIALLVALNILRTGFGILHRSIDGLMDVSIPDVEKNLILSVFDRHRIEGIQFHALRTRRAGSRRFVSFDVLVPGDWSVERGHLLLESVEEEIRGEIPGSVVSTHIEPLGGASSSVDPCSSPDGDPSGTAAEERTPGGD